MNSLRMNNPVLVAPGMRIIRLCYRLIIKL